MTSPRPLTRRASARSGAWGSRWLVAHACGCWGLALGGCGSPAAGPAAVVAASAPVATVEPANARVEAAEPSRSAVAPPGLRAAQGASEGTARSTPAIAALLGDGFEARLPQRAKVFVDASGRVRADERTPAAPLAPSTPKASSAPQAARDVDSLVVLERRDDPADRQVRLAIDTRTLRVALWMDPAQLAPVLTQTSSFAASARAAPSAHAPVGRPGLRVKLEQSSEAKVEVTATYEFSSPDSGTIALRGWLDKNAVGYVYEPALDTGSASAGVAQFIDTEVDIAARAGGLRVAHVGPGGGGIFFPVQVLGRAGGFAEVLLTAAEVELRGFVPQSALEPLEPETARGWGRGRFRAKLWQRWPKEQVRVPVGTCIYDAPDGEVIGVMKRSHVDNVVAPEGSPAVRAYRLPYDAVGYLFAEDLEPATPDADDTDKTPESAVDPERWHCPKR